MSIILRKYAPSDWPAVKAIYQAGIDTGIATFETAPKGQDAFETASIDGLRFVAEKAGAIAGWAVLWPVSERCCYRGVAEVSVYISPDLHGAGIGTALLSHLVRTSETAGYWTLQAGIFVQNEGSLALHKKCGFRQVGIREKLGQNNGVWQDIALLERRSPVI